MAYSILLVDDSKDYREEFTSYFKEYVVSECSNGRQALEKLSRPHDIDLVVLDVVMPGISGLEVLKRIKSEHPQLGVIILTSKSNEEVAIQALKAGADDYVRKGDDISELETVITKTLERTGVAGFQKAVSPGEKVEKIKQLLEKNYDKKFTLEDAAGLVSLSPKYLSRIFLRFAGMNFSEYKLNVKVDKAKELLTSTGLTVSQIAYKLGYENPESFIRIFEKYTENTPTEYRKISKR